MEQHPVPQDITGFQFKLVGEMTLKQFSYLAGGSVIAFVFYSADWATFVRMPLALLSFLTGVSFAFVPIGERPLETWVANFFKSVYHPTQYVWKKNIGKLRSFSADESPILAVPPTPPPAPPDTQKLTDYLQTLPPDPAGGPSIDDLLRERESEIQKLGALRTQQAQSPTPETAQLIQNYQKRLDDHNTLIADLKSQLSLLQKESKSKDRLNEKLTQQKQSLMSEVSSLRKQVTPSAPSNPRTITSSDHSLPPNTVSGLVRDTAGKTVDNVIVLIKNAQGTPVRALRTNKLGQFLASTPLENGQYTIELEKDGLTFSPVSLTLSGSPIPALDIKSP